MSGTTARRRVPAPGWLSRLSAGLASDGAIATATPWSNAGVAAAWPRSGEIDPVPDDLSDPELGGTRCIHHFESS